MKKIIVTAALVLAACGEPEKSLTYFENHPEEIAPTLKKCASTPGAKNCENADMAGANLASRKSSAARMKQAEEDKRRFMEGSTLPHVTAYDNCIKHYSAKNCADLK